MINTLTLNPAIDRVLYLDKFEKNVTNRVDHSTDVIGGKGTHVSINLRLLGLNSRAFGIVHGGSGERIIEYLRRYDLDVAFLHRKNENSRTNYLFVEKSNDCTIVAEKGVSLVKEDLDEIVALLKEKTAPGDDLVISGDASNYSDPLVYNEILEHLKDKRLKIFLDTSGPTLLKCIEVAPFLIKPNLDELSLLCGKKIAGDDQSVLAALQSLDRYQVEIIAVSLGKDGSIVKCPQGIFKAIPPRVNVCNTIGCGDSYLAGLIYGFNAGAPIEQIIKTATAVSAATAESSLSVGFDPARADQLIAQCQVKKIG
ncbi:fructose-1-phosphate kinase [Hydrogenispora ethanolica]|uniref:Tagatose-6-phosphate kinase n=1 Tax=Hydrogenispora ethanolica TaxID=1082276 RepID=A0A4R1SBX0_HYDET|nr:1-phosphofructokinase family hexose kinase [Hydrogenispora ethanolica]TCL77021.1 fructose-1-phosphate kinase [Hydrogenispora ethanolica]